METKKNEKNDIKYNCLKCNYITSKKTDYNRHLLTAKHVKNTNGNVLETLWSEKNEKNENNKNINTFACKKCNKEFLSRSGLWKHNNNCKVELVEVSSDNSNNQLPISNDVIMKLLNDNQELKNIIVQQQNQLLKQQEQFSELIPKIGNNNNTINNNQKFNINVFLNEQCKDAINLSDFIKSLHVTLEQLDFTNKNGLADGISKTIIDNMSKLSIYERPMHCTDVKRETLYIKEDNAWSKDKAKEKVKSVIKKTSSKNFNALMDWKTLNPEFMKSEDKTDYFTKTISTIGKSTDSIDEKVIKKLCKEIYVKDSV